MADEIAAIIKRGDATEMIAALGAMADSGGSGDIRLVHALGQKGDPRAVAPIGRILLSSKSKGTRSAAAAALGRIGDASAVPALTRALDDKEAPPRSWAVKSLGLLRDRASVPRLIGLLEDDSNWVRESAARALGQIGDHEATMRLVEVAREDPKFGVRRIAAAALVEMGDSRAVRPMREAFEDAGPLKRRSIHPSLRALEDRFG